MRRTGARWSLLVVAASLAACTASDTAADPPPPAVQVASATSLPQPASASSAPVGSVVTTAAVTAAVTDGAPEVHGAAGCPPVDASLGPAGLVAFDAATGEPAWEVEIGAGVTIAATGGWIVVGDGWTTRAFDASGRPAWCVKGGGQVVAVGDTVVVARPAEPLVGLDPATGAERWRSEVIVPAGVGAPADRAVGALDLTLVAGESNVYVSGLGAGTEIEPALEAVDAATGERRWSYRPPVCSPRTEDSQAGPPSTGCAVGPLRPVEAGMVYVEDVDRLRALDPVTGKESWSAKIGLLGSGLTASDAVVVDQVPPNLSTAAEPAPHGELVGLHPGDGSVLWRRPFGGFAAAVAGALVVALQEVPGAAQPAGAPVAPAGPSAAESLAGPGAADPAEPASLPASPGVAVTAVDALSGIVVWERLLAGVFPATGPATVGGALVIGDTSAPRLVAVDAATGADRWVVDHPNPFTDSEHPFDGSYRDLRPADGGRLVVGVIPAEEPHRD